MPELSALYREVVLDHSTRPRNFGTLAEATHSAESQNPLCGDRIHVDLVLDGDAVKDVRFHGFGCAIATASASLMTESLKGKTRDQVRLLSEAVHELCIGRPASDSQDARVAMAVPAARVEVGELAVFEGVRRYPLRAQCATLAWQAMRSALDAKGDGSATGN